MDAAAERSCSVAVGSMTRARWFDHAVNRAWSCGGTPNISAMTITGNDLATAVIRSKPAGSSIASSSPPMSLRIRVSRALMLCLAKALLTSARNRA